MLEQVEDSITFAEITEAFKKPERRKAPVHYMITAEMFKNLGTKMTTEIFNQI